VLEEPGELVQSITAVLAGAQGAGVDPAAVTGLAAAARALDPGAGTGYDAGSNKDRHPGAGYGSDGEMLEAVSEAEMTSGSGCGKRGSSRTSSPPQQMPPRPPWRRRTCCR
jgi:hypothetical protein